MTVLPWILMAAPVLLTAYAYVGYPLALVVAARLRRSEKRLNAPAEWPSISICVPAYNEEAQIRGVIESLLRLDYPADRRQILVVSDGSTDRTDAIVEGYAGRGVELLRMPQRGGKGAAERAALPLLRGEIIVNTDASIRIEPGALKRLISAFGDPSVGLASGRDVSVARVDSDANVGEAGYVGYEMKIRRLETRLSGIVGASGCFYAIRSHLHRAYLPDALSRDFASALITREHGYRAVSVDDAVCLVPRTPSLHREYHRKVRTITRGMETLWYKRRLMNPLRYGAFAWMLVSHKVCRWLGPWSLVVGLVGLILASETLWWSRALLAGVLFGAALAATGWVLSGRAALPRVLSYPAFLFAANVAVLQATFQAVRGTPHAMWEPTRREVGVAAAE